MTKPQLVVALPCSRPLSQKEDNELRRRVHEVAVMMPEYEVLYFLGVDECAAHSRNAIVHEFLALPNGHWLWFTGLGIEWEASDLVRLVQAGKPVLGALYTTAEEWPRWECKFYEDKRPDDRGIMQVPETGGNALLVHRTVFERILGNPTFPLEYRDENTWEQYHAFFQQARVKFEGLARLLRDEHFFHWLCREAAIGVFVHTQVQMKRTGGDGSAYPRIGQEPPLLPTPPKDAGQWPRSKQTGKLVICIQHWRGDRAKAEELFAFIVKHTATKCDCALQFVEEKQGLPYPQGPNKIAFELLTTKWAEDVKGVLLLEPDCVPMARDWVDQLSEEWDRALGQGKLIMGAWTGDVMAHLNGNLIFSPKLANMIDLGDKPPRRPWDVAFAAAFRPHWCKTGLIKNLYRSIKLTDAQIETPECGTKPPVLIHGCRDESAWNYAKRKLT